MGCGESKSKSDDLDLDDFTLQGETRVDRASIAVVWGKKYPKFELSEDELDELVPTEAITEENKDKFEEFKKKFLAHGAKRKREAPVRPLAGDTWFMKEDSEWLLREKIMSWTGDDFSIKNAVTGETVLRADAKFWSWPYDKIKIIDPSTDEEVFTVKTVGGYGYVKSGGETLFTIREVFFSVGRTVGVYEGDADFTFTGNTEARQVFTLKAGMFEGITGNVSIHAGPSENDPEVASAHEKRSNLGGFVTGADEYEIKVKAGTDVALILAMMIVYDQIEPSDNEN